jgi:hypothetical protein
MGLLYDLARAMVSALSSCHCLVSQVPLPPAREQE